MYGCSLSEYLCTTCAGEGQEKMSDLLNLECSYRCFAHHHVDGKN